MFMLPIYYGLRGNVWLKQGIIMFNIGDAVRTTKEHYKRIGERKRGIVVGKFFYAQQKECPHVCEIDSPEHGIILINLHWLEKVKTAFAKAEIPEKKPIPLLEDKSKEVFKMPIVKKKDYRLNMATINKEINQMKQELEWFLSARGK